MMISAVDIHKSYSTSQGAVHVLKGIDVQIERGAMVAIMGPSGCGKTTLLNCLSGIDDIDSGEITIDGQSIQSLSERARTSYRASRMGFVFQIHRLLPIFSAVENVELPLLINKENTKKAREQAMQALSWVDMAKWHNHRPNQLSGGQQQRVQIARALVNAPAIVWADEPTGNLDADATHQVMQLFRRLNQSLDQTIVIITHDPEVGALCDYVVTMSDGRLTVPLYQKPVANGSPAYALGY